MCEANASRSLSATAGSGRTVGVVIVDHGSRKPESNQMLDQIVSAYKQRTGEPLVQAAHMELASPTINDAFAECAQQGADTIVLSPFFLSPGRHWQEDLPALANEAADLQGVDWCLAEPLGTHPLLANVLFERAQSALCALPERGDQPASAPAKAAAGAAESS